MRRSALQSLPNPATQPLTSRRQGPRTKAAVTLVLLITVLLVCFGNTQHGSLSLLCPWPDVKSTPEATADRLLLWRDASLLVDKSEYYLPSNFHPLGPDADLCYQLGSPEFDVYMSDLQLKASNLLQPTMADDVTDTFLTYYPSFSRPTTKTAADGGRFPKVLDGPHSQTVWQTDKSHMTWRKELRSWDEMHKEIGWTTDRLDDAEADAWVHHYFAGTDIEWTWKFMTRPILRADLLRYLLMFTVGGFYVDADTNPLHPVSEWGVLDTIVLDISRTDGPHWRENMAEKPSVVLGLEVNPKAWEGWTWIARPISFVQYAFGSTALHPIFLDVIDRIVQKTKLIDERERWMEADRQWRQTPDEISFISQIENETQRPPVLEWTGPTVFTDAIMSWVTARYKISWQRIRGYDRPVRIGDVLILPHGAFSAVDLPDHVNGGFLPQAHLEHFLHGSSDDGWKQEGS